MKETRERLRKEAKKLSNELRNTKRVQRRLKAKARSLSAENLVELLAMKAEKMRKDNAHASSVAARSSTSTSVQGPAAHPETEGDICQGTADPTAAPALTEQGESD